MINVKDKIKKKKNNFGIFSQISNTCSTIFGQQERLATCGDAFKVCILSF